MNRTKISQLAEHIDQDVVIAGWIDVRRDQGKLIFFDFRDESGKVQGVVLPKATEALEVGSTVRPEWVVEVHGHINKRPDNAVQADKQNGDIELKIEKIIVLNEATTPPIDISTDGMEVSEDVRLTNRYIDLRRERLQKNIRTRHEVTQFVRNFLSDKGFLEIETPMLTKSTPEGSRDFIVPSRLDQGHFYALPQSPQQYKQLLMASGFERYFQIARCFRDEDTRGDRQPEFTQIDLEMSFVDQDQVMSLNEEMILGLIKQKFPGKKLTAKTIPTLTYAEAMEKYGTDSPDVRENTDDPDELGLCWIVDFPFFEKTENDEWTFTHNPFSAPKPEFVDDLLNKNNIENIIAAQYDLVLNGNEIGGGSVRAHTPQMLQAVFEIMGYEAERIEENFTHMLAALGSGTPPHGGIAYGLDRLVMILQNEPNIREVIAFAKTGEGRDLLMSAPAAVDPAQLGDVGLEIDKRS